MINNKQNLIAQLTIIFSVIAVYLTISMFTGTGLTDKNVYNSYSLQAEAWLEGRLDLGTNYSHLELANFNGKYYVSFPPFPSFILLPFVLILGTNTPDNFLTLLAAIISAVYAFKIACYFKGSIEQSIFWALFVTIGSNLLFVLSTGGVWFMAQTFCFAFSMCSIYYALTDKLWHGHISLTFWACAVGCRPFSAVYVPILLYLLYKKYQRNSPDSTFKTCFIKNWKWAISPLFLALIYMILNTLRFGNPISFGHEYLPEFTEAANGQFNYLYLKDNIHNLFRLPSIDKNGKYIFPQFNGVAFWLVSPIYISSFIYLIKYTIKQKYKKSLLPYGLLILVILNLFFILLHKTMGGWHFGNRYTIDLLPFTYLILMTSAAEGQDYKFLDYPLFILGITLNTVGTIAIYNNWL